MASVDLTQSDAQAAIRAFVLGVLPAPVECVVGQDNRVPEPKVQNFVVMTPLRRDRLATNVDSAADARFTGSITGTVLTVPAVQIGSLLAGATIFGSGVAAGSKIGEQLTGAPGFPGTYAVSPAQTLSERTLASGAKVFQQSTDLAFQLDVHGPAGADNAQIISTLFRDQAGIDIFAAADDRVVPLYCEDPRQMPFVNAEKQYEDRWTVEAHVQVKPNVAIPQQYADAVSVDLVSVDAAYPPAGA
jgi:hypothetical protein